MNLFEIVQLLESVDGFNRCAENMSGFAGFRDKVEVCTWRDDSCSLVDVTVNDDVVFSGVWKCFLLDDLEGVWYFVVLQQFGGRVVRRLFPVLELEGLVFS